MSDLTDVGLPGKLLRRHVGRRAGQAGRLDLGASSQPEVGQPHAPPAVDHDVGRLEIAVEHPLVVGSGQPGAQLPRHLGRLVRRQAADAPQQRGEVLAVDVLHRQEHVAVGLADVVHTTDVGVADLSCDADLGAEPRQPIGVGGHKVGQELQRDGLAKGEILGAIDLAHAAASEQAEDLVPAGQHDARTKSTAPAAGSRGGRRTRQPRGRAVVREEAAGGV